MEIKLCIRCGKSVGLIHTCSPHKLRENLVKSIEKYNDKLTAKEGIYAEDYIFLDINKGKYKVLDIVIQKFIEHFLNKGFVGSFEISDDILSIVINEEVYIGIEDLELIEKYNINYNNYINLYYNYVDYSVRYDITHKSGENKIDIQEFYLKNKKDYENN